jgi:hypothetical protein
MVENQTPLFILRIVCSKLFMPKGEKREAVVRERRGGRGEESE